MSFTGCILSIREVRFIKLPLKKQIMNPQVLLLAGNEHRFLEPLDMFERYVRKECKIPKKQVTAARGAYLENQRVLDAIWDEAVRARNRKTAFVFVYFGHGYKRGFSPHGGEIDYKDVAQVIIDVPFLFVNATCYSGKSIRVFDSVGLLRQGSVIADARHNQETDGGVIFLQDVVDSWRNEKPFMRRIRREQLVKTSVDFHSEGKT